MKYPLSLFAGAGFAFISQPVLAAPASEINVATTLASLMLVVLLILFLAWLVRRMKLPGIQGADSSLKVLKQLPIGQRERIVLLQVGNEQLLVGVTQHNISLLTKLEEPLPLAEQQSGDFSNHLSKLLKINDKK
ncbi:flagellar biosynthetic protein FliO [Photobacterium lipolyticum]|uniref:Flagellar protein n=1 Tax=Photobacterium lipolyticum TaxID=266810 RepID=A0A2T3N559_9GAMM|nr:flagellar biosynthetic protein FliO [Photobacterium lipolyticum]PSW07589.1 flagellar biosynthetic protein FliO [Photobacterium lipolyticum]